MLVVEQLHKSFITPQGPLPVLQGIDLRLAARLAHSCYLQAGRVRAEHGL